jgi:alkylresorcinol/alkylpyrone synthase
LNAPSLLATGTALPRRTVTQDEALEHFSALLPDDRARRVARQVFAHAGVRTRRTPRPPEEYLTARGFADRNRRFQEDALPLAIEAARTALVRSGADRARVRHLLLSTTTGLATPSLDAPLALALELPANVQRTPLFGLGCASGAASLARAAALLRGDPDALALVVAVELCSHCFDPLDTSPLGIVAASLFGDGAAAVVLAGSRVTSPPAPRLIDSETALIPQSGHIMGWEFEDSGFRLVLDRELPDLAAREVAKPVLALLARNGLSLADVRFPIFHPGGPKVIEAVENGLGLPRGTAATSRAVMSEVGNLSSASVLFVLDRALAETKPEPGDVALIVAPGPGFSVECSLLRF